MTKLQVKCTIGFKAASLTFDGQEPLSRFGFLSGFTLFRHNLKLSVAFSYEFLVPFQIMTNFILI
jgi:hypothetical protein